jgi:RecB family endonuclease NucS
MPIQHAIWKVGTNPEPLTVSKLANEKTLEDMIVDCPSILSGEWMLIGRQEKTQFGGIIDLLAPENTLSSMEQAVPVTLEFVTDE